MPSPVCSLLEKLTPEVISVRAAAVHLQHGQRTAGTWTLDTGGSEADRETERCSHPLLLRCSSSAPHRSQPLFTQLYHACISAMRRRQQSPRSPFSLSPALVTAPCTTPATLSALTTSGLRRSPLPCSPLQSSAVAPCSFADAPLLPWDRRPQRVRQKLIDDARAAETEEPRRRAEMMRQLYGNTALLSSPCKDTAGDAAAASPHSPPLPHHQPSPSSPAFLPSVRSSFSSPAAVRTLLTASSSPAHMQPAAAINRPAMASLLLSPVAASSPISRPAAVNAAFSSSSLPSCQLDRLEQLMAAAASGALEAFVHQQSAAPASAAGSPTRKRSSASVTDTQQLLMAEETMHTQAMKGSSILRTAALATQEAQSGNDQQQLDHWQHAAPQSQQTDAGGARYGRRRMQSVSSVT